MILADFEQCFDAQRSLQVAMKLYFWDGLVECQRPFCFRNHRRFFQLENCLSCEDILAKYTISCDRLEILFLAGGIPVAKPRRLRRGFYIRASGCCYRLLLGICAAGTSAFFNAAWTLPTSCGWKVNTRVATPTRIS